MDIKKAIRLLAPLLVEGVISVRHQSHVRLVEMLHELDFITRSITRTNNQIIINLQILDAEPLHRLLSGEANRFLLASTISHERSIQNQVNNASWQIIENYYAAYYGIHYLLRLTGVSLTNIDSRGINSINRSNLGMPPNFDVQGGLYVIKYDAPSNVLTLTKNLVRTGGSHQEAWQLWEELIEKLRLQTNIDPIEYASISIDLANHKRFLKKSTAKYNPPEIRAEINYQFRGDSWIFEKDSSRSIGVLQRSISTRNFANPSYLSTPDGLISNNKFIISFAKEVFLNSANKYPKGVCRSLSNKYKSYFL